MMLKKRLLKIFNECDKKFEEQFEFKLCDVTLEQIAIYANKPKDSSSLAVTRILFGLAMLFDIPDERGGAMMERRWGDPRLCRFPLLAWLRPLAMPHMALVYAALWLGALGIMLGYKYRVTSAMFTLAYWYLFLAEKSFWNNHSYLFGLVALLLACTEANCYWSTDAWQDPSKRKTSVPYWNYFMLKYQFFILYFMAGLKKGSAEWLAGYSVQNLSEHWVFAPFKLFLTVPQTDYLVVHWFIFAFDLTVAGWMMWGRSRHLAMVLCALFHLMNSRLFRIGMFPWVCLATMPLFYPFDWPKLTIKLVQGKFHTCRDKILKCISKFLHFEECECKQKKTNEIEISASKEKPELEYKENEEERYDDVFVNSKTIQEKNNTRVIDNNNSESLLENDFNETIGTTEEEKVTECNYTTLFFIMFFVILQAFLPYSHFITKGYNNWTNGLYGYSWDMMVHTWVPNAVIVKVVDNDKNSEFYVDPYIFTPNDRWTRHGDMVYQYAHCLKDKIIEHHKQMAGPIPKNLSIYVDVWCSLNGRFVQRMFDPKVDLLKTSWSPFEATPYLMPLLDEALHWRETFDEIRTHVSSWGEYTDVTFYADFPGYEHEKFIPIEIRNVTLTVLGGLVAFEPEVTQLYSSQSHKLLAGDTTAIASGMFHKILNIGETPAYYMYTYFNSTEAEHKRQVGPPPMLPIRSELQRRFANMATFLVVMIKGVLQSIFTLTECQ